MTLFGDLPRQVTLARQIRCVEREVRRRRGVYPTRVNSGRMRALEASEELAAMEAVLETLRGMAT